MKQVEIITICIIKMKTLLNIKLIENGYSKNSRRNIPSKIFFIYFFLYPGEFSQ